MLPSGRAKLFDNRIGWAKSHVSQAGLLHSPRRAYSVITDRGLEVLRQNPDTVDMSILGQFEEYKQYRSRRRVKKPDTKEVPEGEDNEGRTPEEVLDDSYQTVREQVESELLEQILANPPEFLEQLIVDLIVRMGYGGDRKDAGKALGRSGDGGVDGFIKEDVLGLDVIYLQAKRWEGSVGRPEIQKFAGALAGKRAKKGIFITTSSFSREAREYVSMIDSKIILIDGEGLARLMFEHGLGVTTESVYEVKRIDSDYFM